MNSLFFIALSSFAIIFEILSIFSKKIIYALLFAMVTFTMVSGIFLHLGATYNAIVQLMIYTTAIPILIAISIMITDSYKNNLGITKPLRTLYSLLGILILCAILFEFLEVNQHFYTSIHQCSVYINTYSDFLSIVQNIFKSHFILLAEFALGIILTTIGVLRYEK